MVGISKGAKEGVFDKLKNIGSEIKGITEGILGFSRYLQALKHSTKEVDSKLTFL